MPLTTFKAMNKVTLTNKSGTCCKAIFCPANISSNMNNNALTMKNVIALMPMQRAIRLSNVSIVQVRGVL